MIVDLEDVKSVLFRAGEKILSFYDRGYHSSEKEDSSPVTDADIGSNEVLTDGLRKYGFPILSEESADNAERLYSDKVWIIDPLDGTLDFIQKTGEFSILVGLAEKGKPVLGFVLLPSEGILYYAEKGNGAFVQKNGEQPVLLSVSKTSSPRESVMITSRNHLSDDVIALAERVGVKTMKKCGSNGVKLGQIAEGKADFFVNTTNKMGEWDLCGPQVILEEAGGMVSDVLGGEIVYNKPEPKLPHGIFASNGALHHSILLSLSS